jgi:hypothetical protein
VQGREISGRWGCVLSATHYMELNKIKDPAQRRAIADVMEDLTDFASLLDRCCNLELEAVLDPSLTGRARCHKSHSSGKASATVLVERGESGSRAQTERFRASGCIAFFIRPVRFQ